MISIDQVNDDVFSQKMMGDGIAIKPSDDKKCDDITMLVVLDQGKAKSITFVKGQNVVANETEIAQIA